MFSGTDLEGYFRQIVDGGAAEPAGLSAVESLRPPAFSPEPDVRSKICCALIKTPETAQRGRLGALAAASIGIFDADLRSTFFEFLSRTGRLEARAGVDRVLRPPSAGGQRWHQLARDNSAAAEYVAEARVWRSHFEEAAPVMLALATRLAGRRGGIPSALPAIHRSLAYEDPNVFRRCRGPGAEPASLPTARPRSPGAHRRHLGRPRAVRPRPAGLGAAWRRSSPAVPTAISKRPRCFGTTTCSTMRCA